MAALSVGERPVPELVEGPAFRPLDRLATAQAQEAALHALWSEAAIKWPEESQNDGYRTR